MNNKVNTSSRDNEIDLNSATLYRRNSDSSDIKY